MCKGGLAQTRMLPVLGQALHAQAPLSTACLRLPVETVGNVSRKSALRTALPAFHFSRVQFSKTGTTFKPAPCAVCAFLSTFPVRTATTTIKMKIVCVLFRRRLFCRPGIPPRGNRAPPPMSFRPVDSPPESTETRSSGFSAAAGVVYLESNRQGGKTPCLAQALSRKDRSHREPQRWKSLSAVKTCCES